MSILTRTAGVAAIGVALSASAASTKELTYGSFVAPSHSTMRLGVYPFAERLKEQTNGELTMKVFAGGAMGGAKELLGNVRDGIVDSGSIVDIYSAADIPLSAAPSSLIAALGNLPVAAAAMNELQLLDCPKCVQERARNNMIGLAWTASGPYQLLCTREVRTLDDLKGVKVRADSGMARILSDLGAVPVSITTSELFEAMQRGQVDCTAAPVSWLENYKLKELVTHIIDLPLGAFFGTIVMNSNLDTWNGLTDGERKIIKGDLARIVTDTTYGYLSENKALASQLESLGIKTVEPSDELRAAVEGLQAKEFDRVAAEIEQRGIPGVTEEFKTFRGLLDKWTGIMKGIGDDPEAYRKALDEQIFSKI